MEQTIYIIWIIFASCIIWYTFYCGKLTHRKLAFCILVVSGSLIAILGIDLISGYYSTPSYMGIDLRPHTYYFRNDPFVVDNIHKFVC